MEAGKYFVKTYCYKVFNSIWVAACGKSMFKMMMVSQPRGRLRKTKAGIFFSG